MVSQTPFELWSSTHWFGTDQLGRDMFTRLLFGARNTIGIALATTLLAFAIGGGLGIIASIFRGWIDQLLSRAVDTLMAIPQLIFALILLSIFGSSVPNLIIIIAVLDSTRVFRLARSVAMNVVVMDYVEAAKLRGEKLGWVLFKEVLPNIMPTMVAEFGLRFCFVFLTISCPVLPGARHPAADRRLGLDGARERDPHHLWRHHAAAAGGRHCASDRGGQFRGRLVPAQDERIAR